MSSKARSVAVKRKFIETIKGDGQVNKEVNEQPTVKAGVKQETNKSQPPAKKRRPTIYTSEFKAEILEFLRTNKNIIAVRQFGIPESTLRGWISKAAVNEDIKVDEEVKMKPAGDGNTMAGMGPLVTNQDDVSVIIDVPGLGHADSKHPLVTKDDDHKELTNHKGESQPFKISPKKLYTSEFREKVVELGESKGWKAAAEKFGVLATTVGSWADRLGMVTKSKSIIIDDATKDKVVEYSKQMNSWKRAAQKFGFSPKAVACWGKEAGLKLKSHSDISDEAKDEIVKYGVKHNSWNQAACKFGVPQQAVAFWGKKAECKLKPRYPNGFKETVVSFGEGVSWKAAAARFGVSESAVGMWAKQMGKEKRVVLGEEAKQEITKFGVEHNSWKEAAHKFGVSPHTVSFWGKKAGFKLKRTGSKKKSSSGEPPNSDLNNRQNQGLPLGSNCLIDEELEKGNADGQGLRNTVERFGVGNRVMFKWSKKLKVSRVDSELRCAKLEPGQTSESGSNTGVTKMMVESPVKSNAAYNIASVDTLDTERYGIKVECEACGKALAADETLDEHVVSVHLTIEGLCNICGEDSEDFVDHFKVHLKSYQDDIELAPLKSIKKEIPDVNDNQNSKNYTESDLAVKEEYGEEVGETLKGKQWFINPFYSS